MSSMMYWPLTQGVSGLRPASRVNRTWLTAWMCCLAMFPAAAASADGELKVVPPALQLDHGRTHRLLVTWEEADGSRDVTGEAEIRVTDPKVAAAGEGAIIQPLGDGDTTVVVSYQGKTRELPLVVRRADVRAPISFELDVQPVLTAKGCNAGACHGKARGQNGFQLSLLGFDSDFDYRALTMHARGRRVFPSAPERSLLLRKAIADAPHGGGRRLEPGSEGYQALLRWVEDGVPRQQQGEPKLVEVVVHPKQVTLRPEQTHRLIVIAHYDDGSSRDVTGQTSFQSNEAAIVGVDADGLMRAGPLPGEATMMARYMGLIDTCDAMIPLPDAVPAETYAQLPRNNFIDDLVWQKLQSLRLVPSEVAPDEKFARRVYLDIIGRLPAPEETQAFLSDQREDKRSRLIDQLLERPEYADHWANKWVDLLRPNPYRVGIKAVLNYDNWIRQSFRENKPYDQFVRELVTAQGSTFHNGAATLFRDRRSPDELATLFSQLFLGVRLECAKCHHHPFEKWSQRDFYSFAAYFAKVGRKGTGLSPPISGSEEIIMLAKSGSVSHPITGETLEPSPLFGEAPVEEGSDPRSALAAWMTGSDNPFFVQVMANRVWAEMMGRGLVEPVDDLRVTNPPSNGPLLVALGDEFRRGGYDIKHLIRVIANSATYQLSTLPSQNNIADTRNYSRKYRQRLRAEVLLDAICDVTEVPYTFSAMPPEARANQIWTHRVSSLFLDTFGRPDANQDPPCERTSEGTVTQALHLMNAPQIHEKITSEKGLAARLSKPELTPEAVTETLYLTVYCRMPNARERQFAAQLFSDPQRTRRQHVEDLLWAMLNTPEFIFKD